MKKINPRKIPISSFYKKCLQEAGFSAGKFKSFYSSKLRKLVKSFGETEAKIRIKYMVKFFDDIKEEFSHLPITKYGFPHPDLFFNEEIWNYVKSLARKKIVLQFKEPYIPELLETIHKLIEAKKFEDIIRLGDKYGREKVLSTVAKVYSMYRKTPDRIFTYLYYYLRKKK